MGRDSRMWQDSLACPVILNGDMNAAASWVGWAKQKLGFMLHTRSGPGSQYFYPVDDVEVKVDTRPQQITITAGGKIYITGDDVNSPAGSVVTDPTGIPYEPKIGRFFTLKPNVFLHRDLKYSGGEAYTRAFGTNDWNDGYRHDRYQQGNSWTNGKDLAMSWNARSYSGYYAKLFYVNGKPAYAGAFDRWKVFAACLHKPSAFASAFDITGMAYVVVGLYIEMGDPLNDNTSLREAPGNAQIRVFGLYPAGDIYTSVQMSSMSVGTYPDYDCGRYVIAGHFPTDYGQGDRVSSVRGQMLYTFSDFNYLGQLALMTADAGNQDIEIWTFSPDYSSYTATSVYSGPIQQYGAPDVNGTVTISGGGSCLFGLKGDKDSFCCIRFVASASTYTTVHEYTGFIGMDEKAFSVTGTYSLALITMTGVSDVLTLAVYNTDNYAREEHYDTYLGRLTSRQYTDRYDQAKFLAYSAADAYCVIFSLHRIYDYLLTIEYIGADSTPTEAGTEVSSYSLSMVTAAGTTVFAAGSSTNDRRSPDIGSGVPTGLSASYSPIWPTLYFARQVVAMGGFEKCAALTLYDPTIAVDFNARKAIGINAATAVESPTEILVCCDMLSGTALQTYTVQINRKNLTGVVTSPRIDQIMPFTSDGIPQTFSNLSLSTLP